MKLAGPAARKFLTKSVVPFGHGGRRDPVVRLCSTNPWSSQAMELYSTILPKEGMKVLESVHADFTPEQMMALFSTFLLLKHERDTEVAKWQKEAVKYLEEMAKLQKEYLEEKAKSQMEVVKYLEEQVEFQKQVANLKLQARDQRYLLQTTTTDYLRLTNRLSSRGLIEFVQNKLVLSYAVTTKVQGRVLSRRQIWVAILKADMKAPTSFVHACLCEKLQIASPEDIAGKIVDYYQKMSQYLHDIGLDFGEGLEQLPEELNSDQRSILECFSTAVGVVVKWKKSGLRTVAIDDAFDYAFDEDEASSGASSVSTRLLLPASDCECC